MFGWGFWVREHLRQRQEPRDGCGAAAEIDVLHRRGVIFTGSDGSDGCGGFLSPDWPGPIHVADEQGPPQRWNGHNLARGFSGEQKKTNNTVLVNGSICGSVFEQTGSHSKNFNLFISKRTVYSVQDPGFAGM